MFKTKEQNYNKGKLGENLALDYLTKKGYRLIERNFTTEIGEIDLIMAHKKILRFIEVKLKVGDKFGTPEEMISHTKLAQIKRVAQAGLIINPGWKIEFEMMQIEAVCIVVDEDNKVSRLTHYDNIY